MIIILKLFIIILQFIFISLGEKLSVHSGCKQFAIPVASFQTLMASQQLKALTLVVLINADDVKVFLCGYIYFNCQLWPVF